MKVLKRLCVAMLIGVMMAGQIELFGMGNKKRVRMAAVPAVAEESEGEDSRPMQRSRHVEEADEDEMVAGVAAHAAGKNFACEYPGCGHEFTKQSSLFRHKKTVHEGARYYCDTCGKTFSDNSNLIRHKKAVHEGVRYACDTCGKEFTQQGNFTQHKKAVHEGVRYACDECGKGFTQRGHLALHKKTVHEGERYACDTCGKGFADKSHLNRHKKAAHEGVGYQCDVAGCGKDFTNKSNLTKHKKSAHEGVRYLCDTCGKEFTDKSSLTKHKKSAHEGVRYTCDVDGCGKSFTQQGNLNAHKKSAHEGVRYACDVCGKEFTRKDQFSEHKREKRCKKRKGLLLADAACAKDIAVCADAAVDYEITLLQEAGATLGEFDDFEGVVVEGEELGTVVKVESTASAEEMMRCIEDGIGIEELQIKNNPHVTDKELIEIASNCLLLTKLDVSGSTGITNEGIRDFLGRCAGLCTLVVSEHDALSAADIAQLREISPGLAIEVVNEVWH